MKLSQVLCKNKSGATRGKKTLKQAWQVRIFLVTAVEGLKKITGKRLVWLQQMFVRAWECMDNGGGGRVVW